MGITQRGADLLYAFKFLKVLTTPWKETSAFKLNVIDENGKRNRSVALDSSERLDAYTPFLRLAYNIKRLIDKVPGTQSRLGNLAAGLYLMKEKYHMTDKRLHSILEKVGVDSMDFLAEDAQWFILEDKRIAPGLYNLSNNKILNKNYEELAFVRDKVQVSNECYPVGEVFGLPIYEVTHVRTNTKIYITASELIK